MTKNKLTLQEYANLHNCYTAQDEDRRRSSYKNKPIRDSDGEWIDCKTKGKHNTYIEEITDETLAFDGYWKDSLCEPKKEEYKIGKKYIVSDFKECFDNEKYCENEENRRILIAYCPNEKLPFICDSKYGSTYHGYRYIKSTPEYVPYSEPKVKWILNDTFIKLKKPYDDTKTYRIESLYKDGFYAYDYGYVSLSKACREFTWADGSVCGEIEE